jgi:hypothetical protein
MSTENPSVGYLIGYPRVSALEQVEALQHDALATAGCQSRSVFVDKVSGKIEHGSKMSEPRSLQPEQLGDLPMGAVTPQKVRTSVIWEDGVEELVDGLASGWTKRAVRVRFGAPPHQHEVWVWAGAVERA